MVALLSRSSQVREADSTSTLFNIRMAGRLFRNTVSGMHLGYDHLSVPTKEGSIPITRDLGPSRCALRRRRQGGYSLSIKYCYNTVASIAVVGDGPFQTIGLVHGVGQVPAAIWKFIGVRYIP